MALLITTATPTGRARARALFPTGVDVRYLPYDTPRAVRRFLDRAAPTLAIILETELWPNLFDACRRRELPMLIANARLSARSVANYTRFGALFRGVFGARLLIAAQSASDAERFRAIGAAAGQIRVIGNLKFDLEVPPDVLARGAALRRDLIGSRPVWIAGSTHPGEEQALLEAHARLLEAQPDALLIIVPRHPNRFEGVADLLARSGCRFVRRSAGSAVPAAAAVLLADTMGELLMLYAAADIAFVGGSLVPIGGHNLLEPAALGLAVITGPSVFNGREIAALLGEAGGVLTVADAQTLGAALVDLFGNPQRRRALGEAARGVVQMNRGSVQRLIELINTPGYWGRDRATTPGYRP